MYQRYQSLEADEQRDLSRLCRGDRSSNASGTLTPAERGKDNTYVAEIGVAIAACEAIMVTHIRNGAVDQQGQCAWLTLVVCILLRLRCGDPALCVPSSANGRREDLERVVDDLCSSSSASRRSVRAARLAPRGACLPLHLTSALSHVRGTTTTGCDPCPSSENCGNGDCHSRPGGHLAPSDGIKTPSVWHNPLPSDVAILRECKL